MYPASAELRQLWMRELLLVEHRGHVIPQCLADRLPAHDDLPDVRFAADGGPHRLGIAAADQLELARRQVLDQPRGHLGELLRHEFVAAGVHLQAGLHVGLAVDHLHGVCDRQHARLDAQLPTDADVAPLVVEGNAEVGRLGRRRARRGESAAARPPRPPHPRPDWFSGNAVATKACSLLHLLGKYHAGCQSAAHDGSLNPRRRAGKQGAARLRSYLKSSPLPLGEGSGVRAVWAA